MATAEIATLPSSTSTSPPVPTTSVDRPMLLAIIDSWEQQFHQSLKGPHICLETNSCKMFMSLRWHISPPEPPLLSWGSWSEEDLQRLQKAMSTRPSQKWNDATHLRMAKITRSVAFQQEKEMRRLRDISDEEERLKKRKRRLTENCRGCGCGSSACESCYTSVFFSEESFGEESLSANSSDEDGWGPRKRLRRTESPGSGSCEEDGRGSRKRVRREENCHGIGCGSCAACESFLGLDGYGSQLASGYDGEPSLASASNDACSLASGSDDESPSTSAWENLERHQTELNHGPQLRINTGKRETDCHGCGCGNCLACEAFMGDLDDYESLTLSPNPNGEEDWLLGRLWF